MPRSDFEKQPSDEVRLEDLREIVQLFDCLSRTQQKKTQFLTGVEVFYWLRRRIIYLCSLIMRLFVLFLSLSEFHFVSYMVGQHFDRTAYRQIFGLRNLKCFAYNYACQSLPVINRSRLI